MKYIILLGLFLFGCNEQSVGMNGEQELLLAAHSSYPKHTCFTVKNLNGYGYLDGIYCITQVKGSK